MSEPKVQARAQVTVTLLIQVDGGAWGHDCTVSQVHKQALDGARGKLNQMLNKEPGVKILGDWHVDMVTTKLDR